MNRLTRRRFLLFSGAATVAAAAGELVAAGRKPDTPLSVTLAGTTTRQRTWSATLGTIAKTLKQAKVLPSPDGHRPVIAVVGERSAAAQRDQPGVAAPRGALVGGHGVEAGRVGGGRDGPAQVLERAARDPEQEEVEDGQEAELEGDGDRVVVHSVSTLVPVEALRLDVETEGRGPHGHLVAGLEAGRADAPAVDLDPVGRAEVDPFERPVIDENLGMSGGNGR